jgi:hypothetical protein
MFDTPGGGQSPSSGAPEDSAEARALVAAVDALLARPSVELPAPTALERLRTVLVQGERLAAVVHDGVRDLDTRELFVLDSAGSAASWLRAQRVGGPPGLVTAARRSGRRALVEQEWRRGRLSGAAAHQLCAALDAVPDEVDEAVLRAVAVDHVADLLRQACGGSPADEAEVVAALVERAESVAAPAARLEPVLVLLASRLAPAHLAGALKALVEALQPDEPPTDDAPPDPYFLDLAQTTDGWHVAGFVDEETGRRLDAELSRRAAVPELPASADATFFDAAEAADEAEVTDRTDGTDGTDVEDLSDAALGGEAPGTGGASTSGPTPAAGDGPAAAPGEQCRAGTDSSGAPERVLTAGQRRARALLVLLHDAADGEAGAGHDPASVTVFASLATVLGQPGAVAGQLGDGTLVMPRTVQRLGCGAALTAVVLDAAGRPVGASGTHRSATRRERRCLRVRWGSRCAIAGCHRPGQIPHHVRPWWLAGQTRLDDLVPICPSHHHDVHEGQRTLLLRDGRRITPTGWC